MENNLFIILGNQLFDPNLLKSKNCTEVFMAEDFGLCTYQKHHKLKLYLFLVAMREYKDELEASGIKVYYHELNKRNKKESYVDCLTNFLKKNKITNINYFEIEDKSFEEEFKNLETSQIELIEHQNPMFLFSRKEFHEFHEGKKVFRMASFYKYARKKLNILMDKQDNPLGEKWSFDEENRKKIPKNIEIPSFPIIQKDNKFKSLKSKINSTFHGHPGSLDYLWMPTNRKDSLEWLDLFLENKFSKFGDYEDAIRFENNFLFHSALSPVLNMGLLTPDEVVNKALEFSKTHSIPINSLEGFIRQIIGWREFIRGVYHYKGNEEIKSNYWKHDRKLTNHWYEGTTGITPLDDAIKDCIKFGYTHHIPRLMIICNIMNLSKIHPNEIYKWFMEMFVDSSDWVMVPNVYGMGTFADGGIFATKPYSCGSNYILKMSNYKKDSWCDIVDGLYWKFMSDNISHFKSNPRLSILVGSLERMNIDRKTLIFDKASNFITNMTKK